MRDGQRLASKHEYPKAYDIHLLQNSNIYLITSFISVKSMSFPYSESTPVVSLPYLGIIA